MEQEIFKDYKIDFLIETLEMKDISDDEYFSPEYSKYISNSKLKLINIDENGSPEKFHNYEYSYEYNDVFEFGGNIHALLLQPEQYKIADYDYKPTAKMGKVLDRIMVYRKQGKSIQESIDLARIDVNYYPTKFSKLRQDQLIRGGLRYYLDFYNVDKSDLIFYPMYKRELVHECLQNIRNCRSIMQHLETDNDFYDKESYNEISFFIDVAITFPDGENVILPFKLKMDNFTIDNECKIITLNDLKTSGRPFHEFMGKELDGEFKNGSFIRFHYHRQIAVYMLILQLYCTYLLGLEGYTYKSNMLVVETRPPFNCGAFSVNNSYIKEGLKEFKQLMCKVAYCERYGYI